MSFSTTVTPTSTPLSSSANHSRGRDDIDVDAGVVDVVEEDPRFESNTTPLPTQKLQVPETLDSPRSLDTLTPLRLPPNTASASVLRVRFDHQHELTANKAVENMDDDDDECFGVVVRRFEPTQVMILYF